MESSSPIPTGEPRSPQDRMLIAFLVLTTALDIAQTGAFVVGALQLLDLLRGALNGITPPTADLVLLVATAAAGILCHGICLAVEAWQDGRAVWR